MPRLSTLKQFLDGLYDTPMTQSKKKTAKHVGIIVPGKTYVKKIALCVNATNASIKDAIDKKAELIIAHNTEILDNPSGESKLSALKENNMTLYIIGLSMDTLYVYGTDDIVSKAMGLKAVEILDKKKKRGLCGRSRISTYEMFLRRINWLTHEASVSYKNNQDPIKKAAVYMGAKPGVDTIELAAKNNCDTLLCNTGSIALKTAAIDQNMNLFIANYTATEKMALVALKNIIDDRFTTKTLILDETNY